MRRFFAHSTAVIEDGATIGDGSKIWHFSHIMKGALIGPNCNIGQNVMIASEVVVGANVKIQNNVSLYNGVICEDEVFIGPSVVFTNIKNPRGHISRKDSYIKTTIKRGATLGANSTVICDNVIGEYAFIGAGTVVTRSVKPFALIIGNPGVQVGWMSKSGYRLDFDCQGDARCSHTQELYLLKDGQVYCE